MRRDAPSELASPSLTRASHARADANGGNSLKSSGYRTLQGFAQKDLGVDGSNEELGILGNSYYGSTTYFDDEIWIEKGVDQSTGTEYHSVYVLQEDD